MNAGIVLTAVACALILAHDVLAGVIVAIIALSFAEVER